jgi:hypothetical protein
MKQAEIAKHVDKVKFEFISDGFKAVEMYARAYIIIV